jgi:formamidopyrimidine-DNA glycosylase
VPELPEVETIVRQLRPLLANARVERVIVRRADIVRSGPARALIARVTGRTIRELLRRGKRILLLLDDGTTLAFHLGMTGRLRVDAPSATIERHTHLRILLGEARGELRFTDARRFGGVWCEGNGSPPPVRFGGPLGVEPLECTWRRFRTVLDRRRQIKALLMDQRVVAGLGNIYCDESLHAAGIHPRTRADGLSREAGVQLLRSIKTVLRRAIRHEGSTLMDYRTVTGSPGSFQRYHRVYGRAGKTCRQCGAIIVRIVAAGRSTFLCPNCQTLPAAEANGPSSPS